MKSFKPIQWITEFPMRCLAVLFLGSALWTYWPTLVDLADTWSRNPQYSHGYLVPVFALVLLFFRWKSFRELPYQSSAWGLAFVLSGIMVRLGGAYFYFPWFEGISLLFCLLGLSLLVGGWNSVKFSWPALVFLIFMIPLPYRLENALAQPLRGVGTQASTFVLQLFGFPAIAEGNTILLNEVTIGVEEACSGLSMLMVFFAISTAIAFLVQRPIWEKILAVLSAIPIAIVANVARITVTAWLYEIADPELAHDFFHFWAGWFMMPLAVVLLWAELSLISWLMASDSAQLKEPVGLLTSVGSTGRPATPPADSGYNKNGRQRAAK